VHLVESWLLNLARILLIPIIMLTTTLALAFWICAGYGRRAQMKTKQVHGRDCDFSKDNMIDTSFRSTKSARLQPDRHYGSDHPMKVFATLLLVLKSPTTGFQVTGNHHSLTGLRRIGKLAGDVDAASPRWHLRKMEPAMQAREVEIPEAALDRVYIGKASYKSESLPLSYVSSWPIWLAAPDGSSVTQLPDGMSEEGWVNPHSFEQLWIPQDLPAPLSRAAIGVVLKNGVARYIFPSMETTVMTRSGMLWHNRGLNSFPLGKTWMPFGEVPVHLLRLSAYTQKLPESKNETEAGNNDTEAGSTENKTGEPWTPLLVLTSVEDALVKLYEVIANAPEELGKGFCFLLIPLADEAARLPNAEPGNRTRLFLSDVDATPTALAPDERDEANWVWSRGECDISTYTVAAGGKSQYLPAPYKPLYQEDLGDQLAGMLRR